MDQEIAPPQIEAVDVREDPVDLLSNNEALAITNEAVEILRDYNRPIIFELDITHTISLIGLIQLALRHPATKNSPTAQMMLHWTKRMIGALDPTHGTVFRYLSMGFKPRFDNLDERVAGVTPADQVFAMRVAAFVREKMPEDKGPFGYLDEGAELAQMIFDYRTAPIDETNDPSL